ncbi:MAG TPA: DUF5985 family protein [Pyrinomonadaceae bacterium]|jgi:uncharacterized membrane protein HdeD (DUF308 family)|nr:DUF5985 family protein [Pyrinomonadaceae bacterium]
MNQFLSGAAAMAAFTIGLFFLRFWKKTHDRFFLYFAVAFTLEGIVRTFLGLDVGSNESEPLFYVVRLVSFVLILVAIIDKNRESRQNSVE